MTLNREGKRHIVVKLGGSLWRSEQLGRWIAALRRFPFGVTLIPGGGPFADAVRAAQPAMGFSNHAAHKMALLGMEQYAIALADRFAPLALVETPEAAMLARAQGAMALWRPFALAGAADSVAASWDVTSDSLAAWFAHRAGADELLLIKSVDDANLEAVVDPCFLDYAAGLDVFIAGPGALAAAGESFARGDIVGAALPLR